MNKRIIFLALITLVLTAVVIILYYFNTTKEQEFRISELNKYEMIQKGEMPKQESGKMQISSPKMKDNTPIENTSDIENLLLELEKDLDIEDLEILE